MDYEHALKYPVQGDWFERVAIGSGLLVLAGVFYVVGLLTSFYVVGLFILPLALGAKIVVDGYHVRVLRQTTGGDLSPPEFSDPADLVVDGLRALAIHLVYGIPIAVLAVLGAVGFGALAVAYPHAEIAEYAVLAAIYVGGPVVALLNLGLGYFKAASMARFAAEDDLRAAFDVGAIRSVTLDTDWAIAWLLAWGITVGGRMLTFGGIGYLLLVGFVVQFYTGTVSSHVYGRAYAESQGTTFSGDDGGTTDDPTERADWERLDGTPTTDPRDDAHRDDW